MPKPMCYNTTVYERLSDSELKQLIEHLQELVSIRKTAGAPLHPHLLETPSLLKAKPNELVGRRIYRVWCAEYRAIAKANCRDAFFIGAIEADSFQAACDTLFSKIPHYEPDALRLNGARLVDNETDARSRLPYPGGLIA